MTPQVSYDKLVQKWAPVLNEETAGPISDHYRKQVTAAILENQEKAMREEAMQGSFGMLNEYGTVSADGGGASTSGFDPVLISLVRRAMPNLIAYDVCGVQPMTGPTGLIFAMKSNYQTAGGKAGKFPDDEAFGAGGDGTDEPATGFSGDSSTQTTDPMGPWADSAFSGDSNVDDADRGTHTIGQGTSTADGENLGTSDANQRFGEMGFTIEKATVTAKTRALKAEYTMELAQDLKAIHGLDAETELANILSAEILAEINREVIRTINAQAKTGAQSVVGSTSTKGIFDLNVDADGRWSVEKFKGLIFQLEREANEIAKQTRRGRGNFIICSSDVASALAASGMLDYAPAMSTALNVDDTGNTFAGVLNGKHRVYIDPYAIADYITVGYKGSNAYDAGLFYCPYVPLTMVRAVGENTFQPKIGFKTRYGMASNPFVGNSPADGLAAAKSNQYYRIFRVDNILG
jgi:hypothetical protein